MKLNKLKGIAIFTYLPGFEDNFVITKITKGAPKKTVEFELDNKLAILQIVCVCELNNYEVIHTEEI